MPSDFSSALRSSNLSLANFKKISPSTTCLYSEDSTVPLNLLAESQSVSLGAYFNVLRVLGLQNDFLKLADDDEFGRKLQDLELLGK